MKLMYSIHQFDVRMFVGLNSSGIHSNLVQICRMLSWSADGVLYVTLAAWLFWYHGLGDSLLKTMLLAFALERPMYFALKNGFKRNRPQQAIKDFRSVITPSDQFSFPSGHTSAAFMVATMISFFYPMLSIALYLWATTVAFSRVVLGVHFPTDTLMGMVLGTTTALFSLNYII
ncbi:MAG: phosphatase PAP2 family protein [Gammaproteobacteria bacterium]